MAASPCPQSTSVAAIPGLESPLLRALPTVAIAVLLACSAGIGAADAATTIERSVIGTGGGTASGGGYVMQGTLAQPAPGMSDAGPGADALRVQAGFWQPRAPVPDALFADGFESPAVLPVAALPQESY